MGEGDAEDAVGGDGDGDVASDARWQVVQQEALAGERRADEQAEQAPRHDDEADVERALCQRGGEEQRHGHPRHQRDDMPERQIERAATAAAAI